MGISQTTPTSAIDDYIARQVEQMTSELIRNLQYIGESCLKAARQTNSYKDQTGNLRSSIGYVIAIDGRIVAESNFEVVKDGKDGKKSGITLAKDIVRQFPEGVVLVMVAGMNYASYVAATGRDVLDSAELLADDLVPKILDKLGLKG